MEKSYNCDNCKDRKYIMWIFRCPHCNKPTGLNDPPEKRSKLSKTIEMLEEDAKQYDYSFPKKKKKGRPVKLPPGGKSGNNPFKE